ncbi:MAG: S8 family serine peptidase, partial [bacterium]|nr:S8 family serine peptidase [bacterium]
MGWRKIVVTFASATTVGICEVPAVVLHLRAGKIIPTSGVTRVVPDEARASGTRVYLVQFAHRLSRGTCALIKAAGATVCGYIPERALVVRSDEKALAAIADMPGVTWIGLYLPEYKVERALAGKSAGGGTEGRETKVNEYVVSVWAASEVGAVSEAVQRAGGVVRYVGGRGGRGWVRAMMSAEAVAQIAELAAVEWIEAYTAPHFCNDVATSARGINAAEVWEKLGLTGAGQLVGHADSGIDTGAPRSLHPDLRGRIAVAHALVRPGDWSDPLGHGTHTAGSLVGTGAAGHGGRFRGVAPGARLVHQSITDGEGNIGDIVFDFYALLAQAYEHGARIHSDSWGADVYGKYTWLARLADEFVWDTPEMLVVCAAGNNGWDANRDGVVDGMGIIAPATAKNVLSVGGAETWRAPGSGGLTSWTWYDYWPEGFPLEPLACDYVSSSADGVRRGLAAFSSRGPTADNRIKPDIVAPATDIISCRARTRGNMFGWGVYDEYYVFAGGTSMATPLAAGAAALVREWLVTRTGHVRPSAALVKALLLAGAQSLAPGQYGYGPQREIPAAVPNMAEGWGVLDLGNTLAPTNDRLALLVDHTLADTGVTNAYELVLTTAAVVRAWLVYSDYPASLAAAITLVNDLDLVVRAPSGARWYDVRTGQPNRRDNVESVRGVAPAGTCTVWVVGHQVPFAPQPYALVVRISPIPAGVLAVEDVRHEPHVVRPGVPVEVTAHVAHSLPGTLVVELCFSTNQQAWLAMPMTRRNATERGGVYAATISGMALGSAVRYFVAARAADGTRQYSATNAFCVTQGELWVALSGTATPPYDTPECGLRSLKAALEIAQAGSVVMVAPGTYYERGVRIKPFVCVRGVAGPAKTVIYAAGGGPGVVLAGQGAVLEGVTIEGAQNAGDGGGARLYAGARLLNCVVRGNRVLHYGGGVYLEYGGLVSNCSIIGNVAVYAGGGVFC